MGKFAVSSTVPVEKKNPDVMALESEVGKLVKGAYEALANAGIVEPAWQQWNSDIISKKLKERLASVKSYQVTKLRELLSGLQKKLIETRRERASRLYPKYNGVTSDERMEGRWNADHAWHFVQGRYTNKALKLEYARAIDGDSTDYASRLIEFSELYPPVTEKTEDFLATWRDLEGTHMARLKIRDSVAMENAIIRSIAHVEKALENVSSQVIAGQ